MRPCEATTCLKKNKELKKYTVYCHTNKINGKRYVGITCEKPEKRWKNGLGYKHNEYFYNAIQKYGWEEFSHEILFTGLTKEEAEQKEIELIAKWCLTHRDTGYNIEGGGNLGKIVSAETKKKLSESAKKQMTPEARAYLRECTLRQFATKGHPTKGHACSDEKKLKISNAHSFHKKKIGQYTLDGDLIKIYDSLHQLERDTGYFRSAITNYLKGKSNYCYGFIWKYE
jgi:group I intron endonuclease